MFTLGLVSISFRKNTVEEILDACREAGLSSVEWGGDVHVPAGDIQTAERVKRLTEEAGLAVSAYGSYYKLGDETNTEEKMRALAETARALGAPMIRIWGGRESSDRVLKAKRAALVAEAQALADIAWEYGIRIAFECHRDTVTDEYHNTVELLKEIDRENVGCLWQPLQNRTESYNLDASKVHAAFSRHIHVFHWDSEGRYPLAAGHDVWCRYLAPFVGTDTSLMLEFMHDDKLETLCETADALRAIVRDVEKR